MYTPINKHKLSKEGRVLYDRMDAMIKNPLYSKMTVKQVKLKSYEFDLILDSVSPNYRELYKDDIPWGNLHIVRIK